MTCRHCGHDEALPFVDLGFAPPSNAYLDGAALSSPETHYPLRVFVCTNCRLVQTEDFAERNALFSSDYAYFSSFSEQWLAHARSYATAMSDRFELTARSLVVEIAANDGYLLQYFQAAGIPCLGVEPTRSTALAARAKGIEIIEDFFGSALAVELVAQGKSADLMAANNVLAHVPDINDFVAGFALALLPQGVATFEFPWLLELVKHAQFDTIYHEHYSYLSLHAVSRVFAANGLTIFDAERLPTHGGSLRIYAQRSDSGTHPPSPHLSAIAVMEAAAKVESDVYYAAFQPRVEAIKNKLLTFLIETKRQGLKIGAYGAAAKGNTLLNFAGVRPDLLPYVVDRNPAKVGKLMPGSHLPIVDEAHLQADRPDIILILPWNLKEEIVSQLSYVREWDARFATAIPCLQID